MAKKQTMQVSYEGMEPETVAIDDIDIDKVTREEIEYLIGETRQIITGVSNGKRNGVASIISKSMQEYFQSIGIKIF